MQAMYLIIKVNPLNVNTDRQGKVYFDITEFLLYDNLEKSKAPAED